MNDHHVCNDVDLYKSRMPSGPGHKYVPEFPYDARASCD